jgi:hypothetical protein
LLVTLVGYYPLDMAIRRLSSTFFVRHQHHAGPAAAASGEHPCQALDVMTTPERRNSFEEAQVFKVTTRFVVVDN